MKNKKLSRLFPTGIGRDNEAQTKLSHKPKTAGSMLLAAFNADSIVYDNSPWRPGRELDINSQPVSEEDERRLRQNLATRILSNGVEVLVKDKSTDKKPDQRRNKLLTVQQVQNYSPSLAKRSLLSSAVATVINHQHLSAMFPLHQLMQHNYIIKTCLTTYTYLTTIVEDNRSAVSTFETIVSVVTTESLTNLFASDLLDIKPTKTKYMEVKTIQPSSPSHSNFQSSIFPKIDKRIDSQVESDSFELIQPSEVSHAPCTSSCSCSQSQTEQLDRYKTNLANKIDPTISQLNRIPLKTIKYGPTRVEHVKPTRKESLDKNNQPYEYETKNTPTDKIVEKYTEVMSDYSDEKDVVPETELLTNEQAPGSPKPDKNISQKRPEKQKPEKPNKPVNKNKFVVADLIKLGSLGMKGLSQLAPVLEKMTGSFMKRQDVNKNVSTTAKPQVTTLTTYSANKRIDSDIDNKHGNFPIYIPVDELETSESQYYFKNITLHQNFPWEYKHPKHFIPPRIIHESPLVNGGIPISPGEIITANSDVIVGKPAVGGPLTLTASGIKLQNTVNPPPIDLDSYVSGSEQFMVQEKPPTTKSPSTHMQIDDSYDLRPPELPKHKPPNRNLPRPPMQQPKTHIMPPFVNNMNKSPMNPGAIKPGNDHLMKTEQIKTTSMLSNHGTPVFLDYIPSLGKPSLPNIDEYKHKTNENDFADSLPSSSDIVQSHFDSGFSLPGQQNDALRKPFLVDIQPSRVANVLIPHGSSTALVFAGSSEPHKTGDYVDDPLPYSEPGYFGSFSIDAPQMTNVHNVPTSNNKPYAIKPSKPTFKPPKEHHAFVNDIKQKRKEPRRPEYDKIPPPTSNQESHFQIGPHITAYNPDIYNPSNGDFDNLHKIKDKDHKNIDKEYENFLAVPPPPPKKHHNGGVNYDNNRPYNQRPIVHTKPIQDMKVFLNIQHPVPKPVTPLAQEQSPPKITSEIYFASQAPEKYKQTSIYTVHLPNNQDYHNSGNYNEPKPLLSEPNEVPNSFTVSTSVNNYARPQYINEVSDKDNNMYTVTLNTATNVANGFSESGQVVGSSIPVEVGAPPSFGPVNANIPIGTNIAIKVEDSSSFESSNVQHGHPSEGINNKHNLNNVSFTVHASDNRWNISTIDDTEIPNRVEDKKVTNNMQKYPEVSESLPSINSHANFPMINIVHTDSTTKSDIRPVTEEDQEERRPPKVLPQIPTNSHGWYSNIPIKDLNLNNYDNINNIKVESSTRKIIPLIHDYSNQKMPHFGQKLSTVGKPPSEFWDQKSSGNTQTLGKPFSKPKTDEPTFIHLTTKPYDSNFIVANIGTIKQPVYDIPIRDHSDDYTTAINKPASGFVKPVYENAEEVYDGQDTNESGDSGEISQESMSVPIVSTSHSKKNKPIKISTTQISLLKDEIFEPYPNRNKGEKDSDYVDFNAGTQTEKPFIANKYNRSNTFQSNTIKPIESNKYYNMKPRPFTINTATTLDHQLHQPHWQINQLWENTTNLSSDESIELNMGEEISTASVKANTTKKPLTNKYENKYKKPSRPVFSVKQNNTFIFNDSIITSTVHISDKKPLTVLDKNKETTLTSFTIPATDYEDKSSSEIIDLSPPPPTLDYFKPSSNDETIMGMSPPPPRTPVIPPVRPPNRSTPTPRPAIYRTKPPRTLPPRVQLPRPTRKPIKDREEISTYRPYYDGLNVRRPGLNRDQPSSQLLPPPMASSSYVDEISIQPSVPNVVFPSPTSSGWLTSSGVGFSSSFDFGPTSIYFPEVSSSSIPKPTDSTEKIDTVPETSSELSLTSSPEPTNNYKTSSSVTTNINENGNLSLTNKEREITTIKYSKETSTSTPKDKTSTTSMEIIESKENSSSSFQEKSTESSIQESSFSEEDSQSQESSTSTERNRISVLRNKDRTRKPYHPIRENTKNRYQPQIKPTLVIKPTKTLSRPEILYSTHTSIRKIRPIPTRSPIRPSIIESSEYNIEDDYIKPTEVLKPDKPPTASPGMNKPNDNNPSLIQNNENIPTVIPTHHAGNEVKVYDEIIPTKTEFKTTVITLTKTLLEPPKTVSSIDYVNLTHTLTVTHTKTSLISQANGAVTQTLILTNTQTSTVVDVITKVHTEVQPTTIIETVTKHIPIAQVEPTPVIKGSGKSKLPLDDITMSSEEDNLIINSHTTENIQTIEKDEENETFFVVMNKSQNGGSSPPVTTDIETDYDSITRNEQVNNNGVSQVLFGEILLAGTPYLETTNIANPTAGFSKECQPDCKASRNERCQRIDSIMKCVCRPGFARMFPDRPCKPTYTYSVKLALSSKGKERLKFHQNLADNTTKEYNNLALATHEGINRMVMQSDLRDVYHGVHISGFQPVEMRNATGKLYQGVVNDFYVQLSDNAHESRLKEVIEKYLRNNNYSLGGTDVYASSELINNLHVSDFDECTSGQFHDCSEHAQCFNLRGTYTCSCLEGFADLSVNNLYPGRICSAEPVGCELCNYHGACYSRDDRRVLCECFQWYAGSTCQVNLKVVLISMVTVGALLTIVLVICAVVACSKRPRPPQRSIVTCIQGIPKLHQGAVPKQRADRRALISERAESGDASSIQNASLPYMPPSKKSSSSGVLKKCVISEPPAHDPPPPPAPAVMIPRARLHPPHRDSKEHASRKQSLELSSEDKLISYLESGANANDEQMRRKHSMESSYSAQRERHSKQGALVSAGFKVSTTIRVDDSMLKEEPDDVSSVNKRDLEDELDRYDSLRKSYSHEELSEWTDAERRIGELTLSEARSVGGTLPASTGRAASSTRLTHQEANTMAERDLGSTFLLPHVHLYKPNITSDVSDFDSL